MHYPIVQHAANERASTSVFKGLNRTYSGNSGEWTDCDNLDTLNYPCLVPRKKHGEVLGLNSDNTLHGKICACAELLKDDGKYNGFTGVILSDDCTDADGNKLKNFCFVYNGEIRLIGEEKAGYTSSLPNRTALWIYNTERDDVTEEDIAAFNENMERIIWTVAAVGVRYVINGFDPILKRGRYFVFDSSESYDTLNKEKVRLVVPADAQASYTGVRFGRTKYAAGGVSVSSYINFMETEKKSQDFADYFSEGDYLLINNVLRSDGSQPNILEEYQTYPYRKSGNNIRYAVIHSIETEYYESGSFKCHRMYYYTVTPSGKFVTMDTQSNLQVQLGIFVPPMQHIAVMGRRIWGVDADEDKIYASVFDTPFKLMNTDRELDNAMSWQISPGTADTAVGVFPAVSELLAMKKNSVIRINGTAASSFMITGIFKNCGCIDINSCAEASGTVYYLGYNGFYSYDGAQPELISNKLNCRYSSAIAYSDGMKYYASAVRADNGEHEFLVYDIRLKIWLKWSKTPAARGFMRIGDAVYICWNENDEGHIMQLCGGNEFEDWSCESVRNFEDANTFKAVNELWFRCKAENGIRVFTSVNDSAMKEHKELVPKDRLFIYKIPVRFLSGDYWSYRIEGSGNAVVQNIERVYEEGGGRHYAH